MNSAAYEAMIMRLHCEPTEREQEIARQVALVWEEYGAYCESPEAPQQPGPCPIRAEKYREIHDKYFKDSLDTDR